MMKKIQDHHVLGARAGPPGSLFVCPPGQTNELRQPFGPWRKVLLLRHVIPLPLWCFPSTRAGAQEQSSLRLIKKL